MAACLLFTANTACHVLEWHKRFRDGRATLQAYVRLGQTHRVNNPTVGRLMIFLPCRISRSNTQKLR